MGKRSISDDEVALIRAMLKRGIANRDIQFFFNRPDRPVNTGRISQIKKGTYAKDVKASTDEELDAFLATAPRHVGGVTAPQAASEVADPTSEHAISHLFREKDGKWRLLAGENDRYECKKSFSIKPLDRFAPALRSIAGLANNLGGYVFFGVENDTFEVVGLKDSRFVELDIAEFNRCISSSLEPVPVFSVKSIELGGKLVGVIHVEQAVEKPIVASRSMDGFTEGGVYFRYAGESKLIKPAELRRIIAEREHRAVAAFAEKMSKAVAGSVAFLDLDTGSVEGKSAGFVIDEALLPMLQFVREGEFNERRGAPALRLLGEAAFKPAPLVSERIVREAVTDEATLLNFLREEPIEHPKQYVLHACHSARRWMPLFYYWSISAQPIEAAIDAVTAASPTQRKSREYALRRLQGTQFAYQKASGPISDEWKTKIANGDIGSSLTLEESGRLARAIIGLEKLEQYIDAGLMFVGTPDEVFQQLKTFHADVGGFGNLLMMGQAGTLDHQETVENLSIFSAEVMPRLGSLSVEPPDVRYEAFA